jgi:hypothetical protein
MEATMSRSPRAFTLTLAFALFVLSVPALSRAQTPDPVASSIDPGSASVGLNAGVLLGPGEAFLALGPNVTFNASRKRALQISSSLMTREDDYSRDTVFFYALQYRRTIRETGDSRVYWTAGVVGIVEHERMKAVNYSYRNVAYTSPASTHTMMLPPVVPVGGFGIEKFVAPRLAIRGDVVISFLVMRAAVGVSVPVGRLK